MRALESILGCEIGQVELSPHAMQSSCSLMEVSLETPAGTRARLMLKDLSERSRHRGPSFMYDERREIEVYRRLHGRGVDMAQLIGADADRHWLLIERIDGVPLWQSGARRDWCRAAEWLADLHELGPEPGDPHWLRYDRDYYGRWFDRAVAFAPRAGLSEMRDAHETAVAQLLDVDTVIVHGDYYPANVIVCEHRQSGVCPLDFELAGIGAGVLDLAALITGLQEPLAGDVVAAYLERLTDPPAEHGFERLLLCARLHLAVRWLGWLPHWEAPGHQRFDWAGEARVAAGALEAWG
jgi:aminoglycoside phosphotransferase